MMSMCCSRLDVYNIVNNQRQTESEVFALCLFSGGYGKLLIQYSCGAFRLESSIQVKL
jgi:hypothetical protein